MKNPPISLLGKVLNPYLAADLQLAYYFKALKHSSSMVSSEVKSLTWDVNTSRNKTELKEKILTSLNFIYANMFSQISIDVLIVPKDSAYEITIELTISDNGEVINLGKLVNVRGTKVDIVKHTLNNGVRYS